MAPRQDPKMTIQPKRVIKVRQPDPQEPLWPEEGSDEDPDYEPSESEDSDEDDDDDLIDLVDSDDEDQEP